MIIEPPATALDHSRPGSPAYRAAYAPSPRRVLVIRVQSWIYRWARRMITLGWSPEDDLQDDLDLSTATDSDHRPERRG